VEPFPPIAYHGCVILFTYLNSMLCAYEDSAEYRDIYLARVNIPIIAYIPKATVSQTFDLWFFHDLVANIFNIKGLGHEIVFKSLDKKGQI
jgi:hypothetical protein